MATVRGMTPEAIRALLKREIGDYQALSIAVSNAQGASESAVAEVENLRNDFENMEFDPNVDMSEYDKAMAKFEEDMEELNKNLESISTEALARENRLTALQTALEEDREGFNQEMQKMAKQISDSKEALKQELTEATEKLSQNLTEVGTNLSNELEKANKTLSEDLAKDLKKLNTDLSKSFGKDLKNLEDRQNSKNEDLDKQLKDYKDKTDSKMGTLLSEIDKAKAYADGLLQPGNLVWNPMALADARGITVDDGDCELESVSPSDRKGGALKITKTGNDPIMIEYGSSHNATFELNAGDVLVASAWVRGSVEIPKGAIILGFQGSLGTRNPDDIPANTWTKIVGEIPYPKTESQPSYFWVQTMGELPVDSSVIIYEPHLKKKVTSDLIVDGAVSSKSLATGAVTAGKIAADAVTANNIAAGAVNADKIVANSIGADQLAANAVTADKIAANAVDADKIKAKSIGSDQIAANAVTAEKLAAKAVKAENIDANAVTAQKIASDAVTADKIAANSVDARKLTIMPGNLFPDPRFLDSKWSWGDNRTVSKYFGYENGFRIEAISKKTGSYYFPVGVPYDTAMRLEPGAAYRLTCRINFEGENPPDRLDVYLRFRKNTGDRSVTLAGGIARTEGNTNIANAYGVGSMDFVYPDDAQDDLCTIGFFLQKEHESGSVTLTDVTIVRAADASLIVKGGVQADHIATNAVTADKISASAVTADKIASGAVEADKIAANAVSAKNIASEAITTRHMAFGSINGDRIATNTLHASRIRSGSLTSDNVRIKDGAIKTAMIEDGSITNAKIKDLNASKIKAGTINSARIGSNSIDSRHIKANSITGSHIKADSISVGQLKADAIIQSGMSLIPTEATGPKGELQPIWWNGMVKFPYPEYDGEPWYGKAEYTIVVPKTVMVKIIPYMTYRLEFNIQANTTGSVMFIEMRDQNGDRAVLSGAPNNMSKGKPKIEGEDSGYLKTILDYRNSTSTGANYLVDDFTVPAAPTKVVGRIKFKPNVTHVYLSSIYFNHPRGSTQDAQVAINNLRLEAEVPSQKAIDNRIDYNEHYTQQLVQNIARKISSEASYRFDTYLLEAGYYAYSNSLGFSVRSPSSNGSTMHIYMDPNWKGKLIATVIYDTGGTVVLPMDSDKFRIKRPYNNDIEKPPYDTWPWYNRFKYNAIYIPVPSDAKITYTRFEIQRDIKYEDALGVLSFGKIPSTRPLAEGPTYSSHKDAVAKPPWDIDWYKYWIY